MFRTTLLATVCLSLLASFAVLPASAVTTNGPGTTPSDSIQKGRDGDLNADGSVNAIDLTLLLQNWGMCFSSECAGDLNHDSSVDVNDLEILLKNWG